MALSSNKSYTHYIRLASIVADVLVVVALYKLFFGGLAFNSLHLGAYLVACWSGIAYFSGYYDVYRYTPVLKVAFKLVSQFVVFTITTTGFFVFAKYAVFSGPAIAQYIAVLLAVSGLFKFALYYHIKSSATALGSGNAIIIGSSMLAQELGKILSAAPQQQLSGFFSKNSGFANVEGGFADVVPFANANNIDAIYCSLAEVTRTQIEYLVNYAVTANKTIKFIPDAGEVFAKSLYIDYYEEFPLLSLQKTPLHNPVAQLAKRVFDIIFSSLVIVFVLSWLTPIIALFIKLESKGPVFFKQGRPGIDETEFLCFKFRSMGVNRSSEAMAVKNDMRVTKTGKFLRKTSLDELPQFLNVFIGDMSVVGPRPQIWFHNNEYKKRIHKFTVRLHVKPGITGLAQVSGYRGEINTDAEMQNRIRYDVFYIENWSMLLDVKIIIQTVVNIFMGEEKAY